MENRFKIILAVVLVVFIAGLAVLNSVQVSPVMESVLTTLLLACMLGVVAILQFSEEHL